MRTVSRATRALLLSLAALCALPCAAPAALGPIGEPDAPATEVEVGEVLADAQAINFSAPVKCVASGDGSGACALTLRLSWQRTPPSRWAPSGPVTVVAQQQLSIPVGQRQTVAAIAPAAKLRDVLSPRGGAAIVSVELSDPSGSVVDAGSVFVRPPSQATMNGLRCGGPMFLDVLAGTFDEQTGSREQRRWDPLRAPQIARGVRYRVTSRSARVRYAGITVTARKGSELAIGCGGLSDYNHRRLFQLVLLTSGTVRLQGIPRGPASFAAAVETLEGNLGLRRRERADLTVTHDAHRLVSTMQVRKGRSGQVTPTFHGAKSSPCTSGSRLSVNLYGHIRRLG
jgi:hypothetical protein